MFIAENIQNNECHSEFQNKLCFGRKIFAENVRCKKYSKYKMYEYHSEFQTSFIFGLKMFSRKYKNLRIPLGNRVMFRAEYVRRKIFVAEYVRMPLANVNQVIFSSGNCLAENVRMSLLLPHAIDEC
ncbi:hypothetical protein CEXT_693251 [Caerostris extrusa]|uniref:Uncharacterized protein n=1 Tax=Caerostris extrusa TaxID=172846 RepID=A0AAV4QD63_CAEEX|nr:hypothetical protein CEXT_693251 [Caerostris extrusa]